ncbi:MAG: DUF87 domain-containing protein [Gemmatimonadetes bacterium]|nr:DUF87 domain-containing protein [Gemmatimonadota bacterium]
MQAYEKIGAFYLGRKYDPEAREVVDETILYDAKDLTTHAVCVGMTGSGKTGLCVSLLEEAALDGIPVIAIDPKGDLGNLMLTFPNLATADFKPWVDEGEAARKGMTVDEYAKRTADLWKNGLAQWNQDGDRIKRLRESAETAIYTPGSSAGISLSVLRSLQAPPEELRDDLEAMSERVTSAVSGLLGLLGIDADPLQSQEHILLSNIMQRAWAEGRDIEIAGLIREIQSPPFDRVGVLDLDTFFPAKERGKLAMRLNNLLASPGFAQWMEGEPLAIPKLLYTEDGKPRISILSIAHLNDEQRMFFVTLVLNELVAWMRTQPGTTSLRAILYMDEVFGYFPPSKNPPSKTPMLTLLKQARAFGLGCVLATQNPVDLDYKGLSNTGTWFLGRLQTERDKMRVIDGLEGAAAATGAQFERGEIETILSGLGSRVFLMNNVHEDAPVLFHTRWAMSYLRGPLTRAQIEVLMEKKKAVLAKTAGAAAKKAGAGKKAKGKTGERPALPAKVEELFRPITKSVSKSDRLLYRPGLLGVAKLHYVSARHKIDVWKTVSVLGAPGDDPWADWEEAAVDWKALPEEPDARAEFATLASEALSAKSYTTWEKQLKSALYQGRAMKVWKSAAYKVSSMVGETEGEFRARLVTLAREDRDLDIEKLRAKYAPKLARMEDRIRKAEQRVEKEQEQYKQQKLQTVISVGAGILGAVFGRKSSGITKATTAVRGAGRAARERGDISRAEENVEALQVELEELNAQFEEEIAELEAGVDPSEFELAETDVRPRKTDIEIAKFGLLWRPWKVDADGIAEPADA